METSTKWLIGIVGAVTAALVGVGILEETKSKPKTSSGGGTGAKAPPAGGCPPGTYWNSNACIPHIVFQAPAAQSPQSITSLTLDAGNLNPAPIKSYSGPFNVYSPPVQGNTGGGYITGATSSPANWILFVQSPSSSQLLELDGSAGTASITWYDATSGQTLTTNLKFVT